MFVMELPKLRSLAKVAGLSLAVLALSSFGLLLPPRLQPGTGSVIRGLTIGQTWSIGTSISPPWRRTGLGAPQLRAVAAWQVAIGYLQACLCRQAMVRAQLVRVNASSMFVS
jgi:hypothetical protein